MSDNVESDRLGKGTALSNSDNVTLLDGKRRRAVSRNVGVTLLETTVLGNIVQVIPSDDDRSPHLGRDDDSLQDGTANRNVAGKGALLVDVIGLNGRVRRLDTKTDALYEAHRLITLVANGALTSHENGFLLLVSLFILVAFGVNLCDTGRFKRHGDN